jgi:hypothetical protein
VHVAWEKAYPGYLNTESDVAYRNSENQGQSWSPIVQFSSAHNLAQNLDMAQNGDTLHLVWSDERELIPQIYYCRAVNTSNRGISSLAVSSDISRTMNAILTIHPNPFNPSTAISYELRAASQISLKVYDTAGRLVSTLTNGWQEAGTHAAAFDGSKLPSGLYFVRLQAGEVTAVQKVMLLK